MNWDQIKDNWKAAGDKIKLTWGKLSGDDLTAIFGQGGQKAGLRDLHRQSSVALPERR